jgi:hypothetical protein
MGRSQFGIRPAVKVGTRTKNALKKVPSAWAAAQALLSSPPSPNDSNNRSASEYQGSGDVDAMRH